MTNNPTAAKSLYGTSPLCGLKVTNARIMDPPVNEWVLDFWKMVNAEPGEAGHITLQGVEVAPNVYQLMDHARIDYLPLRHAISGPESNSERRAFTDALRAHRLHVDNAGFQFWEEISHIEGKDMADLIRGRREHVSTLARSAASRMVAEYGCLTKVAEIIARMRKNWVEELFEELGGTGEWDAGSPEAANSFVVGVQSAGETNSENYTLRAEGSKVVFELLVEDTMKINLADRSFKATALGILAAIGVDILKEKRRVVTALVVPNHVEYLLRSLGVECYVVGQKGCLDVLAVHVQDVIKKGLTSLNTAAAKQGFQLGAAVVCSQINYNDDDTEIIAVQAFIMNSFDVIEFIKKNIVSSKNISGTIDFDKYVENKTQRYGAVSININLGAVVGMAESMKPIALVVGKEENHYFIPRSATFLSDFDPTIGFLALANTPRENIDDVLLCEYASVGTIPIEQPVAVPIVDFFQYLNNVLDGGDIDFQSTSYRIPVERLPELGRVSAFSMFTHSGARHVENPSIIDDTSKYTSRELAEMLVEDADSGGNVLVKASTIDKWVRAAQENGVHVDGVREKEGSDYAVIVVKDSFECDFTEKELEDTADPSTNFINGLMLSN